MITTTENTTRKGGPKFISKKNIVAYNVPEYIVSTDTFSLAQNNQDSRQYGPTSISINAHSD